MFTVTEVIKSRQHTFLDDDQVENTQICVNDAATHGLASTFAIAPRTIAGMASRQQQADAASCQHSLLHWKPLLVIATRDTHHIALANHKYKQGLNSNSMTPINSSAQRP